MKKLLLTLALLVGLILLTAILVPLLFKDDIEAALNQQISKNLNAQVYYNTDQFSLTLFKSFPDISLSIGDFGLVGQQPFANDTLLAVDEFNVTLDLMSVIKGDHISILNIGLVAPKLTILVLKSGEANYDIMKSSQDDPSDTITSENSGSLNIAIQGWQISNAQIIYDDQSLPMKVTLLGLNHEGAGDFEADVFDMVTNSTVDQLTLNYDGVEYISEKRVTLDLILSMDLENMRFTFKENQAALNDFKFGFEGFVAMPSDDIDMDISFNGNNLDIPSILSLVPGIYSEYMDGVAAGGSVSFNGSVKGIYNDSLMPRVQSNFSIRNGQIKYGDYPIPMEDIQVAARFDYPSTDLRETKFEISQFHMLVDGEELGAYLLFSDLEDYSWDLKLDGNLDLEKVSRIIALEDMKLKGKINANLATKGRMSLLDKELYDQLPTTGSIKVADFYFESPDLPQGFGINSANLSFDPESLNLNEFQGNAGRTDMKLKGRINNYLQYALSKDQKLFGELDFSSNQMDVNEWMTTESDSVNIEDTTSLEVVRIPENIDFTFTSKIGNIKYDNLELKNFDGKLIVRDAILTLEKTKFELLDGVIQMNGTYQSAKILKDPIYDFDLAIQQLSIPKAFNSFVTIQKLVPVAEKVNGKFSTDFKIGGTIGQDMMPIYDEMYGRGLVEIAQASLDELKVLTAVSSVSKLNQTDGKVTLKDVIMATEIKGGRLYVEPFDLNIGGRKATVGGSTGIDGSLDYLMAMNVPSGQVGNAINSLLSSTTGMSNVVNSDVTLNLGISGTYDDPKVKLLSAKPASQSGKSDVKSALKDQAKDKIDEVKNEVTEEAKQQIEEAKEELKDKADEEVEKATEEIKDKAADAIKDIFGKKKKKDGG